MSLTNPTMQRTTLNISELNSKMNVLDTNSIGVAVSKKKKNSVFMKTNILKLFSSSSPQSNRMHHELDTVNLISHRLSQRNHNVPKTYAELAKAA
jgi:hypothetical protein